MIFFANGNAPGTDNDIRLLCRLHQHRPGGLIIVLHHAHLNDLGTEIAQQCMQRKVI